ncbi:MAG: hypothetical protein AB8G15_18200 [Saprospiraceae bacterium]
MKKICFTFAFFALLAIVISSCGKTENVTPVKVETPQPAEEQITEGFQLKGTENITMNHDLMEKFRVSEDFQTLQATQLDWEHITLAKYQETDMQALIIPYLGTSAPKYVYTTYVDNAFRSIVLEFDLAQGTTTAEDSFTGNINLYTPSGVKIVASNFLNSELVSTQEFNVERDYWWCVRNCVVTLFPQLPWWWQNLCGAGFGGCAFGANPYACAVLVSCTGGYLLGCVGGCY